MTIEQLLTTGTEYHFSNDPLLYGPLRGTIFSLRRSTLDALLIINYTSCLTPQRRILRLTESQMAALLQYVLPLTAAKSHTGSRLIFNFL